MTIVFDTIGAIGPGSMLLIGTALVASGVIKGITGAGAPIFAIPTMAYVVDVRFAILTMLLPNLLTNIWQSIKFRHYQPDPAFVVSYVVAGGVGVACGSVALAQLSTDILSLLVSGSVFLYIAFRLAKPDWKLSGETGRRLAMPAGLGAGLLQGSTGLAAPVLLTYLNALRLERLAFVATVSLVFVVFSVVHISSLAVAGMMSVTSLAISATAFLPVAAGMVLGSRFAEKVDPRMFDRIVLVLLTIVAVAGLISVFN